MFCRNISWFICTFVTVAIATGYRVQDSNTGSDSKVSVHQLRTGILESSIAERVQGVRPKTSADLGALLDAGNGAHSSAPVKSGFSPYHATKPHRNHSGHQTPTTAVPTMVAQTITHTDDDHISVLRSLSEKEKTGRLIVAAKEGAVGELEALLAAGANVSARVLDMTALHLAAREGRVEAARRLLAAGAAVDARDDGQWTPLHQAAVRGHADMVRLLLAAGADHGARSISGMTPLHWAAYSGQTEAAAALLEAGADRGARDDGGLTPLDYARRNNQQQVVKLLEGDSGLIGGTSLE